MEEDVQAELLAHATMVEEKGPSLGRPFVDTLNGSAYPNMKELRFNSGKGVWRIAFAFDKQSRAVLLVAGDKSDLWDTDEDKFYKGLIFLADTRFIAFLQRVAEDLNLKAKGSRRNEKPKR